MWRTRGLTIVAAMLHSPPSPVAIRAPIVRGSTELLMVVADPVVQVKAPQAYNLVFARCGIDAVAVPAHVRSAHLRAFVHEAMALGNLRGLVVSIPHKTPLMQILHRFDAAALAAGAVNAVRRDAEGALEGALFDGLGFIGALAHHGFAVRARRALLLGAGGAGLAIASALAATGLGELAVFDTDFERAGALVRRVAPAPARVVAQADPAGFDLIVNATPLGLRAGDPLPLNPDRVAPDAVVVDILMTDEPTALLQALRARGVTAFSGHEMLVQQMPAYLDFFGFPTAAAALRGGLPGLMPELRAALGGTETLVRP